MDAVVDKGQGHKWAWASMDMGVSVDVNKGTGVDRGEDEAVSR